MKTHALKTLFLSVVGAMPRQLGLTMGLLLLVGVTEGIGLLMLIPLLQLVGVEAGHGTAGQVADAVAAVLAAFRLPVSLGTVLTIYVLIVAANAFLQRWANLSSAFLQNAFAARLSKRLYGAIARANWLFFSRNRSSDFTHVLTSEAMGTVIALDALLSLLVTLIMVSVYLLLAFLLSPLLTLLILGISLTLFLLFRKQTLLAHTLGMERVQVDQAVYSLLSENFAGMRITKSHGLEAQHVSSFSRLIDRVVRVSMAAIRNRANLNFSLKASAALVLGIFVYLALTLFSIPAAGLLVLLYIFARMVPMFSSIQAQYQGLINTLPSFEAVTDLQARCDAASENLPDSKEPLVFTRSIHLEDLSFSYEQEGSMVLDKLDLLVRAGETTAVVGPSGSGKSTLADLLIGLIRPSEGHILIDDQPLEAAKLHSWREQIGYVPQDAFMFHDTVRANLLLMRPTASDDDLWQALRFASAEAFVRSLPEGLETSLGDRGIRLSGGERQRLALARAILRRPSLLVLDEATSSLDAENEKRIQEAIEGLSGKMTILVIAHRLSTVRKANVIHVLEEGRLVESGSWNALISKDGGRFRALCKEQGLLAETMRT